MSKKNGMKKFVFGTAIGAGLGLLFAPKKGCETREELKKKLTDIYNDMKNQINEIDVDEVKDNFELKVNEIKATLEDMDKEKALEIAKEKAELLKVKAEELVEYAVSEGTPVIEQTARKVKKESIKAAKKIIKKLEEE